MKKILILSFSNLKRDPRVYKQIEYFVKKEFNVTTAGYNSSGIFATKHIDLPNSPFDLFSRLKYIIFVFFCFYEMAFFCMPKIKKSLKILLDSNDNFDFIIANDSYTWPISFAIKGPAKIICDAHEYAPKEFEDKLKWRMLFQKLNYYICAKYLPKADYVLTVSEGIAEEYAKVFKIKKPTVMMNTPPYYDLKPSPVDPQNIKLIHHGGAIRSRKIENMIEMMNFLDDRFTLNLMLIESDKGYLDELKLLALKTGKKINFLNTVSMPEIVPYISQFDIGVYILEPVSFNNKFALPNKIFEFIQARLAIAIGPSPEMTNIVKKYALGWVSDDFSGKSLSLLVSTLSAEKITSTKNNTMTAALQLNFQSQAEAFLSRL